MNGKNMLSGLSFINRKFIEESESVPETRKTRRIFRKPLLIAAIVALMVLLDRKSTRLNSSHLA